ncbi:MAG: hypothetical protein ACYCQJ_02975 [Nitrososphaerales archaeon]
MTGKTSLVKVALAQIEKKKDYQAIYLNLHGVTSLNGFLEPIKHSTQA